MQDSHEQRSFSARVIAPVAVISALLTWLGVGTFGAQGPLTAALAVILVELLLASFCMIAVVLAARISDTYLWLESRRAERPPRPRQLWLWRPLWQPTLRQEVVEPAHSIPLLKIDHWLRSVDQEMQPLGSDAASASVVPFPRQADSTQAHPAALRPSARRRAA